MPFVTNLLETFTMSLRVGTSYEHVVVVVGPMSMEVVLGLINTAPMVGAGLESALGPCGVIASRKSFFNVILFFLK